MMVIYIITSVKSDWWAHPQHCLSHGAVIIPDKAYGTHSLIRLTQVTQRMLTRYADHRVGPRPAGRGQIVIPGTSQTPDPTLNWRRDRWNRYEYIKGISTEQTTVDIMKLGRRAARVLTMIGEKYELNPRWVFFAIAYLVVFFPKRTATRRLNRRYCNQWPTAISDLDVKCKRHGCFHACVNPIAFVLTYLSPESILLHIEAIGDKIYRHVISSVSSKVDDKKYHFLRLRHVSYYQ